MIQKYLSLAYSTYKEHFNVSILSIHIFRICIGIFVLYHGLVSLYNVQAFYTAQGILPRAVLYDIYPSIFSLQLFAVSDNVWIQTALIVLLITVSLLYTVNIRPNSTAFILFILLLSLNNRNLAVVSNAQTYTALLLLWASLLPYSTKQVAITNPVTIGYTLQIAHVYYYAGLWKLLTDFWAQGKGIETVLQIQYFTLPLGNWLLTKQWLLPYATYGVIGIELCIGVLLCIAIYKNVVQKYTVVALIVLLHIGIAATMDLFEYSVIAIIASIPLVPATFWQYILPKYNKPKNLIIYYNGTCGMCKRFATNLQTIFVLPEYVIKQAQTNKDAYEAMMQHNSWVVAYKGDFYFEFNALLIIMKGTYLRYFAYVLGLMPFSVIGKLVYRLIAKKREELEQCYIETFKNKKDHYIQYLAICLIICTIVSNILTLPLAKGAQAYIPELAKLLLYSLNLEQKWSMFTLGDNRSAFAFKGYTVTNSAVRDIFTHKQYTASTEAHLHTGTSFNYSWQKYIENLPKKTMQPSKKAYADMICKTYKMRYKEDIQRVVIEQHYKPISKLSEPYKVITLVNVGCKYK